MTQRYEPGPGDTDDTEDPNYGDDYGPDFPYDDDYFGYGDDPDRFNDDDHFIE